MTNIFSISVVTVQYNIFSRHALITSPFQHVTYCTWFYRYLYCYSTVLCFPAKVTLLLRLNDEFDGIWTSCGLRPRFRRGYGGFGFYNHSDIMTKMVWSQGGHIKRRLLYSLNLATPALGLCLIYEMGEDFVEFKFCETSLKLFNLINIKSKEEAGYRINHQCLWWQLLFLLNVLSSSGSTKIARHAVLRNNERENDC